MPRGGSRPGAGRPRKGVRVETAKAIRRAARMSGMTPLDYMLRVMNNPEADQMRRDRMAVTAAPYVHGKAADVALGKKEVRAAEAEVAATDKFAPQAPPKLVVNND